MRSITPPRSRAVPIGPEDLKEFRDGLGETQGQFAARIGIRQSTLSRWEAGRLPKKGAAQLLLTRVLDDIARVHQFPVRR
jgi:DNA-binding transcriptional regulator YiaG